MVPDMTNLCSYFQIKLNLYLDLSLVRDLCVVVHTFINYVLLGQQVMVCTFDDDVMTTIISVFLMSFVVKLFYGLEYSLVVLRSFVKYNNMRYRGFYVLFKL